MVDAIDHPELTVRARDLRDRAAVAAKLRAVRDLNVERLHQTIIALQHNPQACQPIETLYGAGWIDVAVDNSAWLADQFELVDDRTAREMIRSAPTVIFEGAQGVLLDENHGFHPHTTWSTTTFANADALLDEAGFPAGRIRLGVLRSYFTRHGPGPLVTEDAAMLAKLPEPHNDARGWQGGFRVGAFDAVAARYALAVAGGVDELAVTHLDRLPSLPPHICTAYECDGEAIGDISYCEPTDFAQREGLTRQLRRCRPVYTPIDTHDPDRFIATLERELGVGVSVTSQGPTAADKRRRIGRS